jgi:hypothetical protein
LLIFPELLSLPSVFFYCCIVVQLSINKRNSCVHPPLHLIPM